VTSADTTAPTIKITSPTSGLTVRAGLIAVAGTASDNSGGSGVKMVQVKVDDGSYVTATITQAASAGLTWSLNVNIGNTGSHKILSRVTDNAGNQSWSSVTITVQ